MIGIYKHKPCSEETKKKIGISNKGKIRSTETIEKNRLCHIGLKRSLEAIEKFKQKMIGHTVSKETRRKISIGNKGRKFPPEFGENIRLRRLGKKATDETKKKMSFSRTGEKSPCWKGGISVNVHSTSEPKYKKWRVNVFERDNWACQTCGIRGCYLEAHHIKSWAKYPELRYELLNGVTLCKNCHNLTDNYRGKKQYG